MNVSSPALSALPGPQLLSRRQSQSGRSAASELPVTIAGPSSGGSVTLSAPLVSLRGMPAQQPSRLPQPQPPVAQSKSMAPGDEHQHCAMSRLSVMTGTVASLQPADVEEQLKSLAHTSAGSPTVMSSLSRKQSTPAYCDSLVFSSKSFRKSPTASILTTDSEDSTDEEQEASFTRRPPPTPPVNRSVLSRVMDS